MCDVVPVPFFFSVTMGLVDPGNFLYWSCVDHWQTYLHGCGCSYSSQVGKVCIGHRSITHGFLINGYQISYVDQQKKVFVTGVQQVIIVTLV